MKETLEERFGLDAARIMEAQSKMLFEARHEVCELHEKLEQSHKAKKHEEELCKELRHKVDELKECFAYALKMYNYACTKCKILISNKELYEALGERPSNYFALYSEINIQ